MKRITATLISLACCGAAQAVVNFELPTVLQQDLPYEAYADIQALDLDGDARADLVLRSFAAGEQTHQVMLNRGPAGFVPGGTLVGLTPVFTDFDGDGHLDAVRVRRVPQGSMVLVANVVSLSRGRGDGTFHASTDFSIVDGGFDQMLRVGDLDADGDLDVVSLWGLGVRAFRNDQGSLTALEVQPIQSAANIPRAVGLAQIDADGRLDLILSDQTYRAGDGAGRFASTAVPITSLGAGPTAFDGTILDVFNADLDADGQHDLIVSSLNGPGSMYEFQAGFHLWYRYIHDITVLKRQADGSLSITGRSNAFSETGTVETSVMRLADVDGDGQLDVVARHPVARCQYPTRCSADDLPLRAFRYARLQADGTLEPGPGFVGGTFAFADMDGDGRTDALGMDGTSVVVRRNLDLPNQRPLSPPVVDFRAEMLVSPLSIAATDPDLNVLDYRVSVPPTRPGATAYCDGSTCYYDTTSAPGSGTDQFTIEMSDRAGGTTSTQVRVQLVSSGRAVGGGAPDLLWLGALACLSLVSVRRRAARA